MLIAILISQDEPHPTDQAHTTLGPAYNEFGYNEHPAVMNNFSSQKKTKTKQLLIDINVKLHKKGSVTTNIIYNEQVFVN